MKERFTCVIPARFQSSRFAGKPLAPIHGKPMILWVAEHASQAKFIKEVIVATDDTRIYEVVTRAGYKAKMTNESCSNGSARVAEVVADRTDEWVFEMQGDQPLVTPEIIDSFIGASLKEVSLNPTIDVVIPYAPTTDDQVNSFDVLKVVVTKSNRLLFQTRFPIHSGFRTLGLYLWKNSSLQSFASTKSSALEIAEDSHPIRLYVNDMYVQGVFVEDTSWVEVDRPYQVKEVEQLMVSAGLAKRP